LRDSRDRYLHLAIKASILRKNRRDPTTALAEFDVVTRFGVRAARRAVDRGLALLDQVEEADVGRLKGNE
jgi:hypothetical protein